MTRTGPTHHDAAVDANLHAVFLFARGKSL